MADKVTKKEEPKAEKVEIVENEDKPTPEVKDEKAVKAEKKTEKTPVDLSALAKGESLPDRQTGASGGKANLPAGKAGKKSFKRRHVSKARAYILCSYNNTSITISDLDGNVLGWSTSGSLGFKGPKKATPFAATLVAQKAVEKTARYGINEIEIYIKGVGGGREASIRALGNAGLNINSIKDITPVPHNGCRPKKPRRV